MIYDDPGAMPQRAPVFTPEEASRLRETLARVAFLEYLEPHELDALIAVLGRRSFAAGETLIREGAPGDCFYILASGTVVVSKRVGGQDERRATLDAGNFFGEIALLNDVPRTASVTGAEPGEVYVLARDDFRRVLLANQLIADIIRTAARHRLADDVTIDLPEAPPPA